MATTRATIRQRVVELAYGDHFAIATTSAGDPESVISNEFADMLEGIDTDSIENWFILITESGHSAINETRRVSAYDKDNFDATVSRAYGATVGSSTDVEVLPWHPDLLHACIDTAGRQLYPDIYLPTPDETLVTNQLGLNMDFEGTFTSDVPASWTEDDSANQTTEKETTRVFHGSNSTALSANGSSDLSIYQDLTINIADLVGTTLTFGGLMWSSTKDESYFQIDYGDGGTNDSPKHDGDEDWQVEEIQAVVPANASRIRLRCYADDSGETVYFDSLYAYAYRIDRYALPTAFIEAPDKISIATSRKDPNRNYARNTNWSLEQVGETLYARFHEALPSGYRMRLTGNAALTLPSSDTASMEISNHRIDLVAEMAASELFRRLASGPGDTDQYRQNARDHMDRVRELLGRPNMRMLQSTNLRYPRK